MPAVTSHAPAKSILFGEHAVVYGRPAIAIPVFERRSTTYILANPKGQTGEVTIEAPDIKLNSSLGALNPSHPFRIAISRTQQAIGAASIPACQIRVVSTIPIASGLGSGASIAVSLARALSLFLGHPLSDEQASAIAFEVDKVYHGTPSGIDNTVIAFGQPVYFVKDMPFTLLTPGSPLDFLIADTGVRSSTRKMVLGLRERWQQDNAIYEKIFERIESIVVQARASIEEGNLGTLGDLMNQNHRLLQDLGVSHPLLDQLTETAVSAGSLGAKLSGAGGGGNMIALVEPDRSDAVDAALRAAGAVEVIHTRVKAGKG
jgi:mevalonate kinase